MRLRVLGLAGVASLLVAGCSGASSAPAQSLPPVSSPSVTSGKFTVETVASGLEHGWDIAFLPDGGVLVPQRPGRLALLRDGKTAEVKADFSDVLVNGEGGLMGMVLSADFPTSREFITCQT